MPHRLHRLVAVALLAYGAVAHPSPARAQAASTADPSFYAVSYVETRASAVNAAANALRQYRDASQQQDGCVRVEFFEQIGRPGHWVIVETWRDQKAFDARTPATQQRLLDALAPIRVSGYDQRPYKTISVAPAKGAGGESAVSVVAHVDVAPNPAVAPMLQKLAEASRQEAGNLRFDVFQHTMRANHFTVVETWQDEKSLDAHVMAPHTRQYRDDLQPLTGSPLDERVYRPRR